MGSLQSGFTQGAVGMGVDAICIKGSSSTAVVALRSSCGPRPPRCLGYGKDGRHWDRDLEARYVVQGGTAKGLAFSQRNSHRGNAAQAELDTDQLRMELEHPPGGGL